MNVRSLVPTVELFKHYSTERDIDVCAVKETWKNKDTTQETLKATIPDGYAIPSQPRQDGCRGGGLVAIYKKESTALIDVTSFEIAGAECSVFKIRINQTHFDICVVYCYPKGSVLSFFEDSGNTIEKIVASSTEHIILGDFNVKADVQNSTDEMNLGDFLEIFNLQNHVSF